ncbi:P2Y purinoceptor 14 [Sorex araneus]|uniref:P2Y purinoceptor 14 n=1 Tax=Sorex araneus TaxID=42254 RepID=UPI002433F16D|nr:P2Y purinoceptor 14 [Sorex araneus]XP_054985708.1 P2Y purinoceptor 14 [Sorex araneus]
MPNTTTSPPSNQTCPPNPFITQQLIPALYLVVFAAGLLLNSVSAWVFLAVPSSKSFVVYLKNIVVADFVMSLTFPFKILSDSRLGPWQLGVFVCRVSAVLFYINMYVSIVFFGLIGFDRYYKIVKPLSASPARSVSSSKLLSVLVWLAILLLAVPNSILTNQRAPEVWPPSCVALKSPLGRAWHEASSYIFVIVFWLVFLLLVGVYTAITRKIFRSHLRSQKKSLSFRKKSGRNIFSIMLVFVVCFVPYHVTRIPYTQSQTNPSYGCWARKTLLYAKEFSLLLSASNVCLDPVIYFFLCRPFRDTLCKKLHLPVQAPPASETSRTKRGQTTQESIDTL